MVTIQITIPKDVNDLLLARCDRFGTTLSELLRLVGWQTAANDEYHNAKERLSNSGFTPEGIQEAKDHAQRVKLKRERENEPF